MNYRIEELEDQIIQCLKSDTANFTGVTIDSHAGGITGMYFTEPKLKEGLIAQLPFVFVQYQGRVRIESSSDAVWNEHRVVFRLFVGARSLRATKESQRSSYALLRAIYDKLQANYFDYTGVVYQRKLTTVTSISRSMAQIQPLRELDGMNEQLIVNLPDIVVYYTDYMCGVTA